MYRPDELVLYPVSAEATVGERNAGETSEMKINDERWAEYLLYDD